MNLAAPIHAACWDRRSHPFLPVTTRAEFRARFEAQMDKNLNRWRENQVSESLCVAFRADMMSSGFATLDSFIYDAQAWSMAFVTEETNPKIQTAAHFMCAILTRVTRDLGFVTHLDIDAQHKPTPDDAQVLITANQEAFFSFSSFRVALGGGGADTLARIKSRVEGEMAQEDE